MPLGRQARLLLLAALLLVGTVQGVKYKDYKDDDEAKTEADKLDKLVRPNAASGGGAASAGGQGAAGRVPFQAAPTARPLVSLRPRGLCSPATS